MEENIIVKKQNDNILLFHLYVKNRGAFFRYYLNLEKYELIVTGEITASYNWTSGTKESFIELMLRSDKLYLLNKLSYSTGRRFDLPKSITQTIMNLNEYFEVEDGYKKNLIEEISSIDADTFEGFYYQCVKLIEDNCLDYLEDIERCISNAEVFPYWLIEAVELFCSEIKPLLKEIKGSN